MRILIKNQRYYSYSYSILIILYLITQITKPISSFSLKDPNFNSSDFTLLGDAQISDNNVVNLTSSSSSSFGGPTSSGQIIYKKPFKFNPVISFSTDFSISTPGNNKDRFAFLVFPSGGPLSSQGYFGESQNNETDLKFVAVEYNVVNDDDDNHVGVNVGTSGFVSNHVISDVIITNNDSLSMFSLKSWIDYEASSKRLEIRLSESGFRRPVEPLMSFPIDFFEMWEGKEVLVGVSSVSARGGVSTGLTNWSFRVRTVPSTLHSEPLDPESRDHDHDHEQRTVRRNKSRFLSVLGALIFGTGCGTLVAFVALFVWVVLFGRHSSGGVNEMAMNQVDFKYEKVNVIVDNESESHTTS